MSVPKDYRLSEVQIEMNEAWARQNPELFTDRVFKFMKEYTSVDFTRNGYVTLIAKCK